MIIMKDDLISRQAAIYALGYRPMVLTRKDEYALGQRDQYDADRFAMEHLKPVQPKKGKWIKVKPIGGDVESYMCPFCKTGDWDISVDSYNYCPYCGEAVSGVLDDPSHPFADDVMMKGE